MTARPFEFETVTLQHFRTIVEYDMPHIHDATAFMAGMERAYKRLDRARHMEGRSRQILRAVLAAGETYCACFACLESMAREATPAP